MFDFDFDRFSDGGSPFSLSSSGLAGAAVPHNLMSELVYFVFMFVLFSLSVFFLAFVVSPGRLSLAFFDLSAPGDYPSRPFLIKA